MVEWQHAHRERIQPVRFAHECEEELACIGGWTEESLCPQLSFALKVDLNFHPTREKRITSETNLNSFGKEQEGMNKNELIIHLWRHLVKPNHRTTFSWLNHSLQFAVLIPSDDRKMNVPNQILSFPTDSEINKQWLRSVLVLTFRSDSFSYCLFLRSVEVEQKRWTRFWTCVAELRSVCTSSLNWRLSGDVLIDNQWTRFHDHLDITQKSNEWTRLVQSKVQVCYMWHF